MQELIQYYMSWRKSKDLYHQKILSIIIPIFKNYKLDLNYPEIFNYIKSYLYQNSNYSTNQDAIDYVLTYYVKNKSSSNDKYEEFLEKIKDYETIFNDLQNLQINNPEYFTYHDDNKVDREWNSFSKELKQLYESKKMYHASCLIQENNLLNIKANIGNIKNVKVKQFISILSKEQQECPILEEDANFTKKHVDKKMLHDTNLVSYYQHYVNNIKIQTSIIVDLITKLINIYDPHSKNLLKKDVSYIEDFVFTNLIGSAFQFNGGHLINSLFFENKKEQYNEEKHELILGLLLTDSIFILGSFSLVQLYMENPKQISLQETNIPSQLKELYNKDALNPIYYLSNQLKDLNQDIIKQMIDIFMASLTEVVIKKPVSDLSSIIKYSIFALSSIVIGAFLYKNSNIFNKCYYFIKEGLSFTGILGSFAFQNNIELKHIIDPKNFHSEEVYKYLSEPKK